MTWIIFALLSVIAFGLTNTFTKESSSKHSAYFIAWVRNFLSLPLLWIMVFAWGFPSVDPKFWKIVILTIPIEIVITVLYFKAIKISPLSLVIPFTAFYPIFGVLGGILFFGESLSFHHIIAIFLLLLGSYFMGGSTSKKQGVLAPILALKKEKGPLFMIIVTIWWGMVFTTNKIAIGYSSVPFFTAIYFSLLVLGLTPLAFKKSNISYPQKNEVLTLLAMGIFNGLAILLSRLAIQSGPVSLVSSIISLNSLSSILFANLLLKESVTKRRILASLIMLLGALVIMLKK